MVISHFYCCAHLCSLCFTVRIIYMHHIVSIRHSPRCYFHGMDCFIVITKISVLLPWHEIMYILGTSLFYQSTKFTLRILLMVIMLWWFLDCSKHLYNCFDSNDHFIGLKMFQRNHFSFSISVSFCFVCYIEKIFHLFEDIVNVYIAFVSNMITSYWFEKCMK